MSEFSESTEVSAQHPHSNPEPAPSFRTLRAQAIPYTPELVQQRYEIAAKQPPGAESNCFGFAFYDIGVLPQDRYIDPQFSASWDLIHHALRGLGETWDYSPERAQQVQAQLVALQYASSPAEYFHAAVVDPQDTRYVMHRPDWAQEVRRDLGTDPKTFEQFQHPDERLRFVYFTRKR